MKNVIIVTHVAFWRQGAGHCARILSLVKYLSVCTRLTVAYGGVEEAGDQGRVDTLGVNFRLVYLEKKKVLPPAQYAERLRDFFYQNTFEVCIIEYLELSFLLDYLPQGIRVLLDTHDLMSDRSLSFAQFGKGVQLMTWEEELEIFKGYSAVILINQPDYEKVSKCLGTGKTILAPHAAVMKKRSIREKAATIGFVASAYPPNIDAITGFIQDTWPYLKPTGVHLALYGVITRFITLPEEEGIILRGFLPDIDVVYDEVDIVINPVRFGAGLKIKNVEALASGLPLVTTSHGARGLEAGAGKAFLVADDPTAFGKQLVNLVQDYELRKQLGENAFQFAQQYFSPEACYEGLRLFINAD